MLNVDPLKKYIHFFHLSCHTVRPLHDCGTILKYNKLGVSLYWFSYIFRTCFYTVSGCLSVVIGHFEL